MQNFTKSCAVFALLFCVTLTSVSPKRTEASVLFADDKMLHFATSYALGLSSTEILNRGFKMSFWQSALYGSLFTLGLGLAKETLIDKKADWGDMAFNGGGAVVGLGFAFSLNLLDPQGVIEPSKRAR